MCTCVEFAETLAIVRFQLTHVHVYDMCILHMTCVIQLNGGKNEKSYTGT